MAKRSALARLSVRQRLTTTVALLTCLALVAVGLTLYAIESRRIDRSVTASLNREVAELRELEAGGNPSTGRRFASADELLRVFLGRNLPDPDEVLFAFLSTGQTLAQGGGIMALEDSPQFPALVDRLGTRGGTDTLHVGGQEYRITVQPISESSRTASFVVVHDISASRSDLHELIVTYTLLAMLSVILITGLASWSAARLLSPVRRLSETAQGISDGDLGGRLEVTGHDDLSDLQRTFNDMLDRLEAAFVTQRQLLDDAGHELRTPLTILRGHLEVLDLADPEDIQATRTLLLDEIDRMSRLVNDLLMLAKARRPDFVTTHAVDVETLTHGILDRARALAPREWLLDGVARTTAQIDGQRITQAMLQLADNAARHTREGDEIGIGSRLHEGRIEWWVRDTGPGVAPEMASTLFERFSRAEHDDEGFGLGLSIVTAIAEAHDGQVVLDDTATGATFRIRLSPGGVT